MIGKIFADRYQVSELIGKGGMAMVYRAVDMRTGHNVAIKILRQEFSEDAEFLNRFQREAEAASKMAHHNIVNLLDIGMDGDIRYLVMEYVQGKTLKDIIREKGQMPPQLAGQIAVRILAALQHAHRNGIIHRDIKPQNILVHEDGHIKVADFGIARMADSSTLTKGDSVMGSVHYFSPEQASGESVGISSDLYSAGVVLYEMLTGRVPFDGDTPVAVAMQHLHAKPKPIHDFAPDVPEPICRVVTMAMEKEPKKRYQAALDMATDLRHALEGREDQMKARKPLDMDASGRQPIANPAESGRQSISSRQRSIGSDSARQRALEVKENTTGQNKTVAKGRSQNPYHLRKPTRKRMSLVLKWSITVLMAGLVFYGLYLGGITIYERVINTVSAPDLVGKDQETAVRQSERIGLNTEIIEMNHPSVASGTVIMQTPEFETSMHKGDTIVLTLSKGPSLQYAPQITGMLSQDAVTQLQTLGLVLSVAERVVSTEPVDTILTQKPENGAVCAQGDTIQVTVSGGSATVPDLLEGWQQEAVDALVQSGLTLDAIVAEKTEDPSLNGQVIAQQPSPGSQVIWGTKVTITVYQLITEFMGQVQVTLPETINDVFVRITLVSEDGTEVEKYAQQQAPSDEESIWIEVQGDAAGPVNYRVYIDDVLTSEGQTLLE